jgi:hypothetical protein
LGEETTVMRVTTAGIATWEDEGGSLRNRPLRLRRRRKWSTWGTGVYPWLERAWSNLWIYNQTRTSLSRAAGVFLALLVAPLLLVPVVLALMLLLPVAVVAIPMAFLTLLLR